MLNKSDGAFGYYFLISLVFISWFLIHPACCGAEGTATSTYTDFSIPDILFLCGEPVPLENRRVWEMLDREFTISVYDRAQVFMWMKRSKRYFPYIEKKLAEASMPDDIKYLALAESALLGYVRSRAGAKGYWQFMSRTGRRYGLRKDRMVDERLNFEESTEAALKYLRKLKNMFGSWTLAMAAYNCGETRLKREIKQQRIKDYYRLNLPIETERYVFRIAAIKIIMEDPKRYGYSLPPERMYHPVDVEIVSVNPKVRVHLSDIADALNMDFKTLKELTPHIIGYHLPTGRFQMKVPSGQGEQLMIAIAQHSPKRSHQYSGSYYVVKPGDTLHKISRKTGVSVSRLRSINGIQGSLIRVGQKIRLEP